MIIEKSSLTKLKDFGLNTYESKLWTALLSRGVSTAGELSDIADVPRSRSYDVLESLEKKGFIIMKLGKPIKYIAVPPEEVLERVKKKIKEKSEKQIKLMNELRLGNMVNELNLLYSQGVELIEPTELSGSLKGHDNIYNHLETMAKKAKKSITIITTAQGLMRKANVLKSVLRKNKLKGVKIRIATQVNKEIMPMLKELSKTADIKHTDIKARFCIVDSKELLFMLLNDDSVHPSYDVGVWVNTGFFSNAFEDMFNSEWKKMKLIEHTL